MAAKKKVVKVEVYKTNLLIYYVIIGIAAFIVYANSLSNEFVFDDDSVVLGDQSITSLSNIPKYFTGQEGFHKVIGRYFRPVVSTTYALDYALYGLEPFGFHLTNVLVHVINSLLFFYFLLLVFKKEKHESKLYYPVILFAGLIFAVHTIHTEAVSWVSGRTDSLSFTFFITAFIYYIKYSEENIKKTSTLILIFFFYLLSLLSKEMAVTLPAAIILYDVFINRLNLEELKKKIPVYSLLAGFTVLFLLYRYFVLKDVPQRDTYFYFYGKDIWTTVFTMLQTVPLYFRLLIVPVNLLYHYSGFMPYVSTIANFSVIFAVIFIVFSLALVVYLYNRMPVISFCLLFFFLSLLPVVNIVPTMNFMGERFLYVSSIIVSLAIAYFALKYLNKSNKNIIYTSFVIVIAVLSYLTFMRNYDWKDNNTLFLSAEGKPGTVLYVNIGNIYANRQEFDKAEVYYRNAIDLREESMLAQNNLGKIFLIKDNFDSAYYYINKARMLDTLSPEPLYSLTQLYAKAEMYDKAIEELEKLQKITPNYMNSAVMLNELKMKNTGTMPGMKKDLESVNKANQLEQEAYRLYTQKEYDKSVKILMDLVKINPAAASNYYNNIGTCYMETEKYTEAKKYFELSIKEDSKFSTAYNNLGTVYEKLGDTAKAKETYKKAIQADSTNALAKSNLEKLK
ncbi:MAG: tetratricopeptide repeat protein [Ignavibacteriae bacterium]|nr:MAG: tetratricopeptide repeat protein [Ignavibacteriota bacterium]